MLKFLKRKSKKESSEPIGQTMGKVWQEFYCNESGEGCGGYVMVKINMALNHRVTVVCPKCGHRHERYIVGGEIKDANTRGVASSSFYEELIPTMAAYSKTPRTAIFEHREKTSKSHGSRDAAVIKDKKDLTTSFLRESWNEKHALPGNTK